MSHVRFDTLPAAVRDVVSDVIPFFEQMDTGRFAVALGGSLSKGTWDDRSDIDFRLYHERPLPVPLASSPTWSEYFAIIECWERRGVRIDGILHRTIADVEASLNAWLAGELAPEPIHWTIWGYHILPDITQQIAVLDPEHILARWQECLRTYPDALRSAVLTKHLGSLRYWRNDYHYRHKVDRGDVVFLAGLSTRLVHDIVQVLCAINGVPFPGDGNNLRIVETLDVRPQYVRERVTTALYPVSSETMFADQYEVLLALIDETEALVSTHHRP
jgi:hypothetical protein